VSAAVDAEEDRAGELRRYWRAVLACFVAAVFGWGFGFSGAACMVLVNAALRWLGPGRLLAAGTVLLGVGAALFSRSEHAWQLFGAAAIMAFGWAGCTMTAIPTALAMYFARQRGLAISLALNDASAAGFTVGPALLVLSQSIGVGNAVPVIATVLLAIILPLIWYGLREPPQPAFPPRGSDSTLLTDWRISATWHFWSIALPFALALSAQVGLLVHLVSLLLPHLGADGAAIGLAVTSIAAISGRLALAAVIDRLPQRLASAASFTTQAGAVFF